MLTRQQQLLILCGALTVAVIIGLIATSGNKPASTQTTPQTALTETSPTTPSTTTPTTTPTKTPTTSAPATTPTYSQLVDSFKASGFRYQFSNCSGTPGSLTMKLGTKYMLDNRDPAKHIIKVGKLSYTIGAYGYTIATASVVGTQNITCDGKGAATLIVQH